MFFVALNQCSVLCRASTMKITNVVWGGEGSREKSLGVHNAVDSMRES